MIILSCERGNLPAWCKPMFLCYQVDCFCSLFLADPREAAQVEEKPLPPTPGLLVAEPYSWKSLVTGQPILRIRTSGTKAAVLVLPPG